MSWGTSKAYRKSSIVEEGVEGRGRGVAKRSFMMHLECVWCLLASEDSEGGARLVFACP